jgi:uncharacterized protein (DUF1697 family)
MAKYVALLRGINVGGANRLSMGDLRDVFSRLGYPDAQTLLQSGNVVFSSSRRLGPANAEALEKEIAARTTAHPRVLILPAARFLAVAAANPLLEIADNPSLMAVTFVEKLPAASAISRPDAAALDPEVLVIGPDAVYQWSPLGISKSGIPPRFWTQFGPTNTTRNWNTVQKIAALLAE